MRLSRCSRILATATIATVLLGSCGTSASQPTKETPAKGSTSSVPSTTSTDIPPGDSAPPTSASPTTGPDTSGPVTTKRPSTGNAYCDEMGTVRDIGIEGDSLMSDMSSTGALEDFRAFLHDFHDAMKAATEVAPGEIKADMVILRDILASGVETADKADSFIEATRGLQGFEGPEAEKAGDDIADHVENECGIDLSGGDTE